MVRLRSRLYGITCETLPPLQLLYYKSITDIQNMQKQQRDETQRMNRHVRLNCFIHQPIKSRWWLYHLIQTDSAVVYFGFVKLWIIMVVLHEGSKLTEWEIRHHVLSREHACRGSCDQKKNSSLPDDNLAEKPNIRFFHRAVIFQFQVKFDWNME